MARRRYKLPRYCNEPDCFELAEPCFSKCKVHGPAAAAEAALDRMRWPEAAAEIRHRELEELARRFGVDTDAMEALVAYIKERS